MATLKEATEYFGRIIGGYRMAKAMLVANKLGIFEELRTRRTPAEVAGAIEADVHTVTLLLRALASMGLLSVQDGGFMNASMAEEYLVVGRPMYLGNNLQFQDMLWENWSALEDVVRTGRPHKSLPELLSAQDPSFSEAYIRGMHHFSHHQARAVAEMLCAEPPCHILDVGGGPGAYAKALLERAPDARATVLDLPTTLAVARELVADHPARARLHLWEGDYLSSSYGEGFDLVLMSHTTHDESRSGVENMLGRAFRALGPGGRVAIHDWVVDDETKTQPMFAAAFSLNVRVYTNGGQVYSRSEYREMLEAAGFEDVTASFVMEDKVENPTCLIVARKPER